MERKLGPVSPSWREREKKKKKDKEKKPHAQNNIYVVRQFAYIHGVAGISLLSRKNTKYGYNVFSLTKPQ